LKNSKKWCSHATSEIVDLSDRPKIDDRHSVDGRTTSKNSSPNIAEEFFNRIGKKQSVVTFLRFALKRTS